MNHKATVMDIKSFANHEIVTIAGYILGGKTKEIDTEDIAIKVNELAPGRFTWHKYKDQINIENVRTFLSDAKKLKNGAYLQGSGKKGWILTSSGVAFAKQNLKIMKSSNLIKIPLSKEEKRWNNLEKARMLAHPIMSKLQSNGVDTVTTQEAESFFRVDDYVTGVAREKKISRILNTFRDDPKLGQIVVELSGKVPMK
jgi:hypothetical protein